MDRAYLYLPDLACEVEPPADGTLSRTLYQDAKLKVVLFGLAAGQELSEHAASIPAVMHFLKGEATVTLGDNVKEAGPGAWVHRAPGLRHAIRAKTPVVMLLLLLR